MPNKIRFKLYEVWTKNKHGFNVKVVALATSQKEANLKVNSPQWWKPMVRSVREFR